MTHEEWLSLSKTLRFVVTTAEMVKENIEVTEEEIWKRIEDKTLESKQS